MQTTTSTVGKKEEKGGNLHDGEYSTFLKVLNDRFIRNVENLPLFTTNVDDLWDIYLNSFPEPQRQYHNCNSCKRFITHFGGLVTIAEDGSTSPAIWKVDDDMLQEDAAGIVAMIKRVNRATVNGVFFSEEKTWGQPVTGNWIHMCVYPPKGHIYRKSLQNAGQAMAEKLEDFKNVQRALEEFSPPMLAQALSVLQTDSLYRSEKVLGPAKWLSDLHVAIGGSKGRRTNLVWKAVATAPVGFCHPRSSMVGTLLEDIAAGLPFEEVSRRFSSKMHPLQYQRPQAAPSAGNIAQAEKIISQLKAAGSLERRFARLEEVDALWRPVPIIASKGEGVFSHLKPKDSKGVPTMKVPSQKITWEKFRRTILEGSKSIELYVPPSGNFTAIVTAANPEAPPILQWDTEENRNPFSWYLYNWGSNASQWGLKSHSWTKVTAVALMPSAWFGCHQAHFGRGSIFILEGAKDSAQAGSGLFPEILKSEFHSIRATIEAYSKEATLAGREEASACGIVMQTAENQGIRVRVTDQNQAQFEYQIDRWE